jgi:putative RecB family exonuclease
MTATEINTETDGGADEEGASAGGVTVVGSLSPSRAGDFMTCPLLYRFRVIDRIPERPSAAQVRGTLVHAVLERLFDMPAAARTPAAALELLGPEWERLLAEEPELATLFDDEDGSGGEGAQEEWLAEARAMVERYFSLEDPRRLEPASRELYVETVLESGLQLRGYIDRLDVAPTGEVRVVDYKTGRAPRADFEARALFQMKFYALVLWRLRGTVPRLLQLMYLGNGEILRYSPDEADLRATERKVEALWKAIRRAMDSGEWRERTSRCATGATTSSAARRSGVCCRRCRARVRGARWRLSRWGRSATTCERLVASARGRVSPAVASGRLRASAPGGRPALPPRGGGGLLPAEEGGSAFRRGPRRAGAPNVEACPS